MNKSPVEHFEHVDPEAPEAPKELQVSQSRVNASGTVQLTAGAVVYIPRPTADPQDPLNMKIWQKSLVIVTISLFSTVGLALVSGFGGLLGFYIPDYIAAGKTEADIASLMTYPNLTMAAGNLVGMPLAIAVGRRCVLLGSTIIMVIGAALCAVAPNFEWHLGARMMVGIAAGQSEALIPMITQEIFFLHERARFLMVQQTVQTIATAVFVLFASPIAGAITTEWWYGLGACLSGFLLVMTFLFVPETKYYRPLSAYQETTSKDEPSESSNQSREAFEIATQKPEFDLASFNPRTFRSNLRLVVGKPEWKKGLDVLFQSFQLLLFPNVLWAMLLNGLTLGTNVAVGTTYGNIVTAPPYNWPQTSASYVNCGQIVTSLLALPVYGFFSDFLIKTFAKRRGGLHEPEVRILPLILPIAVGTMTAVLYGQGAAHPDHYHWFTYAWGVAAYYFTFIGANIVAITYLLDSYPQRASPLLIIICAFRGVIAFGVGYGITPFIETSGYDGAFGTLGALTCFFGLMGIPVFIWGKKIREITGPYAVDKVKKD